MTGCSGESLDIDNHVDRSFHDIEVFLGEDMQYPDVAIDLENDLLVSRYKEFYAAFYDRCSEARDSESFSLMHECVMHAMKHEVNCDEISFILDAISSGYSE